jgi:hypothetical protein
MDVELPEQPASSQVSKMQRPTTALLIGSKLYNIPGVR